MDRLHTIRRRSLLLAAFSMAVARALSGEPGPPDFAVRAFERFAGRPGNLGPGRFRPRRPFAAGMAVGRREPPALATASHRFVLFLEPLPEEAQGDSSHESARVAEYRAWARRVRESGRTITGEKLRAGARVIGPGQAKGEEISPAGSVAGYFVISARDYENALSIARDCPHARHGGTIVVRAIDPT